MGHAAPENRSAPPRRAKVETAALLFLQNQPTPFQLDRKLPPHLLPRQLQHLAVSVLMELAEERTSIYVQDRATGTVAAPRVIADQQRRTVLQAASPCSEIVPLPTCRLTGPVEEAVGMHAKGRHLAIAAARLDTADRLQSIALQVASQSLAHVHPPMCPQTALAEEAKVLLARVLPSELVAALMGTVVRQRRTVHQDVNLSLERVRSHQVGRTIALVR